MKSIHRETKTAGRGAGQPIRRQSSIRWRRSSNRQLRPCSSTSSTAAKLPVTLVPKPKPHAASPSVLPASTDAALPAARAASSSPHLQARPQRSSAAGLGAEEGEEGQRLASLLPVKRRDAAAVEGPPSSAAKPPPWRSSNRRRRRAPRRRRRGGAGDGGSRRWREPAESVGEGAARRRTRLAPPAAPRRGLASPSRPRSAICRELEVREEEASLRRGEGGGGRRGGEGGGGAPSRPPSDGGGGDASEERGSAFLARLSPPMQNAFRVCLLCWRAFRDAQCRLVLQKWQCLFLLKSA